MVAFYVHLHILPYNVGGENLTRRWHYHSWILCLGQWDCWVQKVKFKCDFDLGYA